ncbi:MarR family winged helix-turn-helix transcriptional regulator [Defluviimonas sp. WL0002]|uniref:MarR family winged helix-turn-helix transcriptional regulator n=1 Tax=Albidovulum marisflavi TaxID=2984159 RepID=A0ABT2ZA51_9RHOB|nr:MarR family winged helix-turn-helix transcriptional regulator [Defluviimonas sp. WL0002]MCV2868002.1 MarR family winged helix-turn-helix transcriptional regulator [Defluviimonas sp. WL0002]
MSDEARPYHLDDQVGYILRLVSQRHASLFLARFGQDLTPTQFAAMARLDEVGQCSQNELGRRTAMDVATIKGVVDRLRAKGLVEQTADPGDKRRSLLSLSAAGAGMIAALHQMGHAVTEDTLQPLNAQERQDLLALLRKMV